MGRRNRRLTSKTLTAAEIDNYAAYLKGTRPHKVKRPAPSAYRERTLVGVIPFGSGLAADGTGNYAKTTMTRGAKGIMALVGLTATEAGHEYTSGSMFEAPAGWYPALCIVTLIPAAVVAGEGSSETSAFTGRTHKYKAGRSGSIPFGRKATAAEAQSGKKANTGLADVEYLDMVKDLTDRLGGSGNTYPGKTRLTFQPEVFRKIKADAKAGLAAVPPTF